jgi:hypothetical protein
MCHGELSFGKFCSANAGGGARDSNAAMQKVNILFIAYPSVCSKSLQRIRDFAFT